MRHLNIYCSVNNIANMAATKMYGKKSNSYYGVLKLSVLHIYILYIGFVLVTFLWKIKTSLTVPTKHSRNVCCFLRKPL
jgi:hypothetical protein